MTSERVDERLILEDPSTSYWLKGAVAALKQRDPVDALADAEMLLTLCRQRHEDVLRLNGYRVDGEGRAGR